MKILKPELIEKDEEVDDEKIMNDFIEKLQSYQLFTLNSRMYNKLLMFGHTSKTNGKTHVESKPNLLVKMT